MRGQKAAAINAVVALFQMFIVLIRVVITLLFYLVVGSFNLVVWLYEKTKALLAQWRFKRQQNQRASRTRQLEEAVAQWGARNGTHLDGLTPETYLAAMEYLMACDGASPEPSASKRNSAQSPEQTGTNSESASSSNGFPLQPASKRTWTNPSPELLATGIAVLAKYYRESVTTDKLLGAFYRLDESTLKDSPQTIGQELLIEVIADLFGRRLEAFDHGEIRYQEVGAWSTNTVPPFIDARAISFTALGVLIEWTDRVQCQWARNRHVLGTIWARA